jgi:hypothetical protein
MIALSSAPATARETVACAWTCTVERVPHWIVFTTVFSTCISVYLCFKLQRIERYLHCAVATAQEQAARLADLDDFVDFADFSTADPDGGGLPGTLASPGAVVGSGAAAAPDRLNT